MMDSHPPTGLYRPDAESKEKADGLPDLLKKPVNTLAIVPQSRRITPLFRKTYNVMLHLAQDQGLEHDVYRAPMSAVVRGLDFDSNDTALIKKHLRAMASTIVEWQSPTSGEGSSWAVSGLIGHAELRKERGQIWLEWSYSVKLRQELLRVAARNQNPPSSQSARFPAQIRRPRIQPPAHAGCKRACNQPSRTRPDRSQAHIACKRRPGQIGSPARSICSRSCAARPTSSAFLNSALISTGLASNCSARSLMR